MTISDSNDAFVYQLAASRNDEIIYRVSLLIHNLSVGGRAINDENLSCEEIRSKLVYLNEIQHQASGFIMSRLRNSDYTPRDFVDSIVEISKDGGIQGDLVKSIEFTLNADK